LRRVRYALMTAPAKAKRLRLIRQQGRRAIESGMCSHCQKRRLYSLTLCRRCLERHRTRSKAHRHRRRLRGVCINCESKLELGFSYCRQCRRKRIRMLYRRVKRWRLSGRCMRCGKTRFRSLVVCRRCRDKWNDYSRRRYPVLRAEVLARLGKRCRCCGESNPKFLTVDHIHNDGFRERQTFSNPRSLYLKIKRTSCLRGRYQILCWNCNAAKAFHGLCPHLATRRARGPALKAPGRQPAAS
jgi:hypothetical protein